MKVKITVDRIKPYAGEHIKIHTFAEWKEGEESLKEFEARATKELQRLIHNVYANSSVDETPPDPANN